ncbi:MAG: phosphate ABC transporter substrate-binding protein PstS [Limnochordales bacterium]|nr:phosphate ABC transporter substrate-binding protein PstS [Limnochordales bacterium]
MANQIRGVRGVLWLVLAVVVVVAAIAAVVTREQGQSPEVGTNEGAGREGAAGVTLSGAGATFPQPLYEKWFAEYNRQNPSVRINYQGIGSGGGIRAITERNVDFGATDAPLTDEQLQAAPGRLLHIPTVAGAVAVVYNLPGVERLRLTPEVLADIFLGKITRWNDSRIATINPGVQLPDLPIAVVHRSDGSGTTNILTSYLSAVSSEWKEKVGAGPSITWPVEAAAGKGNPGVAGYVRQMQGAIGYTEYAYARQNNLACALIQNQAGNFVEPSLESTRAALAGMAEEMPADFRMMTVNSPAPDAYPIVGLTWLLVYQQQEDGEKGKALVDVLEWVLQHGDEIAESLDYVPLPGDLEAKVLERVRSIQY